MPPTAHQELGMLMVSVTRLHRTRADQLMEQIGLHRGQARLLLTLSQHDGMTHSEIAERLEISPPAATKVIKRMEQEGYLQRRADPADERVSRVYLLHGGHALIAEIHRAFARLDGMMFDGVPEPALIQFRELLTQLQANLLTFKP